MCEAPICHCHCKPETLKLEVGKTYITKNNTHVKILFYNEGRYIGQAQDTRKYYEFHSNGLSVDQPVCSDLSSEYKEPEYWYINLYPNSLCAVWRNNKQEADEVAVRTNPIRIRINKETKAVEKLS